MGNSIPAYDGQGLSFQVADAKRLADQLRNEATITGGVIRWNSNQQVPPEDCVALAAHIGLPINVAACDAARDADTTAFLAEYRKRPRNDSAEARFERRAAFGPGKTIVDVISGHRYRT